MEETRQSLAVLLKRFEEIAANPLETARLWKERTGGKVVGCVGLYVPEEIIHAAGLLPVVVLEKDAPIVHAGAHVQNFMCGYVRSLADQALGGDLGFLDCLVIHDCCHVIRMVGDLLKHVENSLRRVEFLFLPVTLKSRESWNYLVEELQDFVCRIEEIAGKKIAKEDISASVAVYNRHRRLLQQLYALRRTRPGLVGAVQLANVVKSGMLMPKEEHSRLLEELLLALSRVEPAPLREAVPLVVSGSLCETCDGYILEAIEEAGGVVIDDDLYVGSRYFSTLVDETLPPIEGIASAYVNRVSPCPTRHNPENHLGDYLADMVARAGARAVINVIVKFCEAHYYAYFRARRRLRERGVPEFLIETEHELASPGQIKTRVQGFLEMLRT